MRTGPKERRRSLSVHIRKDAGGGGLAVVVTGNRDYSTGSLRRLFNSTPGN